MFTRLFAFFAGIVIAALVRPAPSAAQAAAPAPRPVPVATVVPAVTAAPVVAVAAVTAQQATPQPAQAPAAPATAAPAQRPRGERQAHEEIVQKRNEDAEQRLRDAEQRRAERAAAQSKGVNVRIDATVIESHGEQVTGRKVLTITLVDGELGSVRSTQQVPFQPKGSNTYSYQSAPLNMDAKAMLRDDGRIRVFLTLEYRGAPSETETAPGPAPGTVVTIGGALDQGIRQTVTVVLESGKPLIVAQSADAVGDRRVALEVKATVLK